MITLSAVCCLPLIGQALGQSLADPITIHRAADPVAMH